jgi:hypothetical protein
MRTANPVFARLAEIQVNVLDHTANFDLPATLEQIHADLHPGQLAFVNDSSTEILGISAGYGAGKTRALCAKKSLVSPLGTVQVKPEHFALKP